MFLKGKRAVVTGSTSGIGLGIARALAAEGAAVVLNGFGDAEAIAAILHELSAMSGADAMHVPADLMQRSGVEALTERSTFWSTMRGCSTLPR